MRAPFQILVIAFRRTARGLEFAVLRRSDADYWQFIAGGGEEGETPLQTAEREAREETGIGTEGKFIRLASMATVPKNCFAASKFWPKDLYVVPEYCFAVNAGDSELRLSHEHTQFRWVTYDEARQMLRWDSNRNALWELNERLKKKNSEPTGVDDACQRARSAPPDSRMGGNMMIKVVNIDRCFSKFSDTFSPKIVAELNGQQVKLVRAEGDKVPWHIHDHEDELFLVLDGSLEVHERGDSVRLNAGELCVVGRGIEHRVVPIGHVKLLLFEPANIAHTGKVRSEITRDHYDRLET